MESAYAQSYSNGSLYPFSVYFFFFYLRLAVIVLKVKVHACIMHAIDKHVEALMRGSRGGSGPGHPPPPRKFKFLKFT